MLISTDWITILLLRTPRQKHNELSGWVPIDSINLKFVNFNQYERNSKTPTLTKIIMKEKVEGKTKPLYYYNHGHIGFRSFQMFHLKDSWVKSTSNCSYLVTIICIPRQEISHS